MPQQNNWFEKHAALTLTLFVVVLLLILDLAAGALFIPQNNASFRTQHFYYHHTLAPDFNGSAMWGKRVYSMTTNSLGFRDSTTTDVPMKKTKKRILCLGDSQTEAVGLEYDKSFAGILSSEFAKQGTEILNASAVSYSPKIHYLKAKYLLEEKGFEVDQIVVFIDISDMQNEIAYESYEPSSTPALSSIRYSATRWFKTHSFIWYSIDNMIARRQMTDFLKTSKMFESYRSQKAQGNTLEMYSSFFSHFDDRQMLANAGFHGVGRWYYDSTLIKLADRGIALGQQNILKLHDLCKKRNIPLTISVHPWQPQISRRVTEDYYVKRWKAFAEKEGIGFINLFPVFISEVNPYVVQETYFIKGDNHWNETGNRKVADELLKHIRP